MERPTMTWRSTRWARWLGWTLVFGLVAAASVFAGSLVLSALPSFPLAVFFLPTIVAAFLIGLRFRSPLWLAGPAVLLMVLYVVFALTTEPGPETMVYRLGLSGEVRVVLYAIIGLMGGDFFFAIPSLLGIWWGKRREVTDVVTIRSSLGGDTSP
jgi:hypothetical protein